MNRIAWLLAGLLLGAVVGAAAQPTTIMENTTEVKRSTGVHVAALDSEALLMVTTNTGVLIARCVENERQAERIGYRFDRLPVCVREVVPDAIDDAWKGGYDEGQRSATEAAWSTIFDMWVGDEYSCIDVDGRFAPWPAPDVR